MAALSKPSEAADPAITAGLTLREGEVLRLLTKGVSDREIATTLATFLAPRRVLLLLDNCERVLAAASEVAALLAASPRLSILATSREPLRVRGEQESPLQPLSLPAADQLPVLGELEKIPAITLFMERAAASHPDFALTPENGAAVAAICRRLDGLPLAIELAAARIKVLPPAALLTRLEHRLSLLTGGRDSPTRQRTMRDAIAWSYDLLSSAEQALFRQLAVFVGGFSLEAAEAVAAPGGERSALCGVVALSEQSLLHQMPGTDEEPRYRMLETVREFGVEQLETSGEGDATRERLAAWCLALVEQVEPVQWGGNIAPTGLTQLDAELPNLRAAINWLLAQGEVTRALRLVVAAEDFWTQRHLTDAELHHWLEMGLAVAPAAPARDRALAHWLLATKHGTQGDDEAALHHAQRMLDAAEVLSDPAALGSAHLALGYAWQEHGDIARAAAAYAEAIKHWRAAGVDEVFTVGAQAGLANCLLLQGDLEAGVQILEEALIRLRQSDPPWFIVVVINLRGYAALQQDDLPYAARLFTEAIDVSRDLHLPQSLLSAMTGLAGVTLAIGQTGRAAQLLGAIETARDAVGIKRVDNWLHAKRITEKIRAALEPPAFEQDWSAGRALPLEEAVAEALAVVDEALTQEKG